MLKYSNIMMFGSGNRAGMSANEVAAQQDKEK